MCVILILTNMCDIDSDHDVKVRDSDYEYRPRLERQF